MIGKVREGRRGEPRRRESAERDGAKNGPEADLESPLGTLCVLNLVPAIHKVFEIVNARPSMKIFFGVAGMDACLRTNATAGGMMVLDYFLKRNRISNPAGL